MMADINDVFGLDSDADREKYAIDMIVLSIQLAIQRAMHANAVTQKVLAERLGVSPARVSQILSANSPNLTLKTVGKIAHALGEDFELVTRSEAVRANTPKDDSRFSEIRVAARSLPKAKWEQSSANSNRHPKLLAA